MPRIDVKLSQLSPGTLLRVEHMGTPIVVIRNGKNVAAYFDRCPHAHWPVSEGEVENGILHCPGHGWQFDIATGRCLNAPAYRLKPLRVTLSSETAVIEWTDADLRPETNV